MKKLASAIFILFLVYGTASPQSCLPDGITFTTQEQIDNFQTNYPGCTEIEGDVIIMVDVITNLDGLNVLTAFGGYLKISENHSLTSLTGLDNVTSIGGSLAIWYTNALTSLTGLDNVTSIGGGLVIRNNNALSSLTGLDNIYAATIEYLFIYDNISLSTCEVQSICDYLAAPNGSIIIYNNATGCNNQEEVEEACELSVESIPFENKISISSIN